MDFKLFLEYKYINSDSCLCGHCLTHLYPTKLISNPHHIYKQGQLFLCRCMKSKIFSNSVRGKQNLIDFFQNKDDCYFRGFCSDLLCGNCLKNYIQPLENGVDPPKNMGFKEKADRYGCEHCKDNQNIFIFGGLKDPEKMYPPEKLMNWYKKHLDDLTK